MFSWKPQSKRSILKLLEHQRSFAKMVDSDQTARSSLFDVSFISLSFFFFILDLPFYIFESETEKKMLHLKKKNLIVCVNWLASGGLRVNPYPDEKIISLYTLKAFADDKFHVTRNVKCVFHTVESFVEKGENAGYQHFPPFPAMFLKSFFTRGHQRGGEGLILLMNLWKNTILFQSRWKILLWI